jgi:small-conductance mechanosensitive channel
MLAAAVTETSSGFVLALAVPHWLRRFEPALHRDYWEGVLWATGAIVAAFVVGRLAARLLHALARRWSRMTATPLDDLVVLHLREPLRWLVPLFFVDLVVSTVELGAAARETLHQLLVVLTILNVGWLLYRVVYVLEEFLTTRFIIDGTLKEDARGNYTQLQSFRNIAGFLIAVISVGLALLSFAGVRQLGTSVLASAGVVGIVVGFAAQKSIATLVSGIVLAVAQPIRIGDIVVVEGQQGSVEEITLTYVVVRLSDLRRLVLPVGSFLDKPFENWSRVSTDLLGNVLLYLDYTVSIEALRQEFKRLLELSPGWDRKTWSLQVIDSTDRTLVVRALMSAADPATAWDLRCEIREKLVAFVQDKHASALPRARHLSVS